MLSIQRPRPSMLTAMFLASKPKFFIAIDGN
jgi:hypothetical protein